jgi:alkylated DNA repair dioxygenase AlkB
MTDNLKTALEARLAKLDLNQLKGDFLAQDEFVCVPDFLPREILESLLNLLPQATKRVHRNYIPKHKKGGSVSRYDLDVAAPEFGELYRSGALLEFFERLSARDLSVCPDDDPHTYALYFYTEPGDHIGYHYDTSYYQGARYTVLLGLVNAPSCKLEYQLHTKNNQREIEKHSIELEPGMLVMFNGDKLRHCITPLANNEHRVALTLEYLTNTRMHPFLRFVSNMKDSIAYFGFRQVFSGAKKRT